MGSEYYKEIICLANSRKNAGSCVAGKETRAPHRWIRPVGASRKGELAGDDISFETSHTLQVLDVVGVWMAEQRPHTYQSENHLIDQGYNWNFVRRSTYSEVKKLTDPTKDLLWHNGTRTYHGLHDQVPGAIADELHDSLKLVHTSDLIIRVLAEQANFSNQKLYVRGIFTWGEVRYALYVTDPIFEDRYRSMGAGEYAIGDAMLCLSLGEIHKDGYAYKLIAGVIPHP